MTYILFRQWCNSLDNWLYFNDTFKKNILLQMLTPPEKNANKDFDLCNGFGLIEILYQN